MCCHGRVLFQFLYSLEAFSYFTSGLFWFSSSLLSLSLPSIGHLVLMPDSWLPWLPTMFSSRWSHLVQTLTVHFEKHFISPCQEGRKQLKQQDIVLVLATFEKRFRILSIWYLWNVYFVSGPVLVPLGRNGHENRFICLLFFKPNPSPTSPVLLWSSPFRFWKANVNCVGPGMAFQCVWNPQLFSSLFFKFLFVC